MGNILEVAEGAQFQTTNEELCYTITTTNWASTPTSISAVAYDETDDDEDVTTTVFPTNSPSKSGDVITLSPLKTLTVNHVYRIEVKFTAGGSIWECYFKVMCTR